MARLDQIFDIEGVVDRRLPFWGALHPQLFAVSPVPDAPSGSVFQQPANSDDWIAWLYHSRLKRNPKNYVNNQFRVISFNYDRLPVARLATMMSNLFDHTPRECLDIVKSPVPFADGDRFIHVNGTLNADLQIEHIGNHSSRPRIVSSHRENTSLSIVAQGLKTIYDEEARVEARIVFRESVRWAKRIFILGLGFHQEMLDLLDFGDPGAAQEWMKEKQFVGATVFGLPEPDRQRLTQWSNGSLVIGAPDQRCWQFLSQHLK